jgi:hypothetical protein
MINKMFLFKGEIKKRNQFNKMIKKNLKEWGLKWEK